MFFVSPPHKSKFTVILLKSEVSAPPVGVVFTDAEVVPGLEVGFES
jgi:hypothetical protein